MIEPPKAGEGLQSVAFSAIKGLLILCTLTKEACLFHKNPANFWLHIDLDYDIISYPNMENCPTLPAKGWLMWAFEQ